MCKEGLEPTDCRLESGTVITVATLLALATIQVMKDRASLLNDWEALRVEKASVKMQVSNGWKI